jgi:hypothetical protein
MTMNPDDEIPIGEGTTTLDYLRFAHPWLATMLDEQAAEIGRLKSEHQMLVGEIERQRGEIGDLKARLLRRT